MHAERSSATCRNRSRQEWPAAAGSPPHLRILQVPPLLAVTKALHPCPQCIRLLRHLAVVGAVEQRKAHVGMRPACLLVDRSGTSQSKYAAAAAAVYAPVIPQRCLQAAHQPAPPVPLSASTGRAWPPARAATACATPRPARRSAAAGRTVRADVGCQVQDCLAGRRFGHSAQPLTGCQPRPHEQRNRKRLAWPLPACHTCSCCSCCWSSAARPAGTMALAFCTKSAEGEASTTARGRLGCLAATPARNLPHQQPSRPQQQLG